MSDERNNKYRNNNEDKGRFGGDDRNGRYQDDDRNGYDDRNGKYDSGLGPKEGGYDIDKDRRMFSRKKSCWFCAKKLEPDWKDAQSYNWLINEFGKISPSRITGLCAGHQRGATKSIKRGRNIGIISYISNDGAY